MWSVKAVLLVLAMVCFLLSALEIKAPYVNPLGAGALLVTLALLIG